MLTAQKIIDLFHLTPLPDEGGLFVQTFVSEEILSKECLPARYPGSKTLYTTIYFLLDDSPDCFSALHRLPTDETYHFYLGDPVELLMLFPSGFGAANGQSENVTLGQDILSGQNVQRRVPRDVWQGSHLLPGGKFALMGTTMAPGFDPTDFTLGDRAELIERYPQQSELIRRLTRR